MMYHLKLEEKEFLNEKFLTKKRQIMEICYKSSGNAHLHRSLSNVLSQKENIQDLLLTLHLSITSCYRS